MTPNQLAAHLRVDRYGDFVLTDAIRPAPHVPVMPRQGFRLDVYRDDRAGLRVPVLAAAVSQEQLFDVFLDLLGPLGDVVDLVLETSHASEGAGHRDLFREHIDLPVLKSTSAISRTCCSTTAAPAWPSSPRPEPMEVQFDEHKLLVVYARDLTAVRAHPAPTRHRPRRRPEAHHRRRTPAQHRPAPRRRVRAALLPRRRRRTGRARQPRINVNATASRERERPEMASAIAPDLRSLTLPARRSFSSAHGSGKSLNSNGIKCCSVVHVLVNELARRFRLGAAHGAVGQRHLDVVGALLFHWCRDRILLPLSSSNSIRW